MEIRKVTLNDIDEFFRLLNEFYNNNLSYETFKKIYTRNIDDPKYYYTVAVNEGQIVGILISEFQEKLHRTKPQCFIDDLYVDSKYRNRGIGKKLLQDAIENAKENDCEVVELTSYRDNVDAHRFYENNNFIKHSYKFKYYINEKWNK